MINCIKVSDIFTEKIIVITASEDEHVKIWDTSMNLLSEFNIRKIGFFDEIPQK